jgi:hypothetical protein
VTGNKLQDEQLLVSQERLRSMEIVPYKSNVNSSDIHYSVTDGSGITKTHITHQVGHHFGERNEPYGSNFIQVTKFKNCLITTECRGRVGSTSASYSGGPRFKLLSIDRLF